MKEVYPGIFLIEEKGVAIAKIKPPSNVYVLAGEDGLIYDSGYGNKKLVKYLIKEIKKIETQYREQGKKIQINRVLLSHWHPDHSAGLFLLQKYLGLKVIMTQKSFDIIKSRNTFTYHFDFRDIQEEMLSIRNWPKKILDNVRTRLWRSVYHRLYGLRYIKHADEIIPENSTISICGASWQIIHTPGHASDHISLYSEEKGILFSGDNVLRTVTTWLGPPECDLEQYIKSVELIQKLPNLQLILACHGSPIENPKERIAAILEHRKERAQQVLDLVNKNPEDGISPTAIVKTLYPNENKMMQNTGRGWICLTLKIFEQQGLIRREKTKKAFLFFPTNKKN